jgi:hypothetical protein
VGPAPSPDTIASINAAGRGRDMEVQYRPQALAPPPLGVSRRSLFEDGKKSIARADATQITFVQQDGTEQAVPSRLLRRVTVIDRGRGALRGGAIGGLFGLGIGLVAGYSARDTMPCTGFCAQPSSGNVAIGAGVALGVLGVLLGAGAGALAGYQENFDFNETP